MIESRLEKALSFFAISLAFALFMINGFGFM
jgi:hypothetical protein